MLGHPLADTCPIDENTGKLLPVVTIVTDNGGPFRSLNFELFITSHPELRHVRTRVRTPRQSVSPGTRVRDVEARTPARRIDAGRASRGLPHRIQTPCALTKPSLGTGPSKSTSAAPARPSPPSNKKKPCQLPDAGHTNNLTSSRLARAASDAGYAVVEAPRMNARANHELTVTSTLPSRCCWPPATT